MLLIGILGLVALGSGLHTLLVTKPVQARYVVLAGIGLFVSVLGFFQAYELSNANRRD
jgi:hypothetical protein